MAKKTDYEMLSALRDELNAILGDAADEQEAPKKTKKSAPAAEDDLDSMSYNDLKKLCKSKGLSAAGNREELIARLNGEDYSEEDDEPVKKSTAKKGSKKSAPVEDDDEDDTNEDEEDGDDDDDEDGEDVQSAVEAATEDMSLEELAEFCEENGLSSKGKRQALIARIVKAVEAGDIELSDDDDDEDEDEEEDEKPSKKSSGKKTSKKQEDEDEDDDDEDGDEEGEPTAERIAALKAYKKDTTAQFKKGELERDDLVEFLCDFYDKDKKAYKKMSDADVLAAYIEASSNLINDEGDIVEEGAYTVNGVPFCCGRPLTYNEDDEQYVCEHCGGEYEADEE